MFNPLGHLLAHGRIGAVELVVRFFLIDELVDPYYNPLAACRSPVDAGRRPP